MQVFLQELSVPGLLEDEEDTRNGFLVVAHVTRAGMRLVVGVVMRRTGHVSAVGDTHGLDNLFLFLLVLLHVPTGSSHAAEAAAAEQQEEGNDRTNDGPICTFRFRFGGGGGRLLVGAQQVGAQIKGSRGLFQLEESSNVKSAGRRNSSDENHEKGRHGKSMMVW
jgi:hypothetical protein